MSKSPRIQIPIDDGFVAKPSVLDYMRAKGQSFGRHESGALVIELSFPGVATPAMTRDDLRAVTARIAELSDPAYSADKSPIGTFLRTARVEQGDIVAQFTEEDRARSVRIPVEQAANVIDYLSKADGRWENFEAAFAKAEADAANKGAKPATPNATPAADPAPVVTGDNADNG